MHRLVQSLHFVGREGTGVELQAGQLGWQKLWPAIIGVAADRKVGGTGNDRQGDVSRRMCFAIYV